MSRTAAALAALLSLAILPAAAEEAAPSEIPPSAAAVTPQLGAPGMPGGDEDAGLGAGMGAARGAATGVQDQARALEDADAALNRKREQMNDPGGMQGGIQRRQDDLKRSMQASDPTPLDKAGAALDEKRRKLN